MSRMNQIGTRKTTVTSEKGVVRVIYHNTCVFAWNPSTNTVTLDSGGFRTNTTKTRINQAFNQFGLDNKVIQRKGEWFLKDNTIFEDGMVIQHSTQQPNNP